MVAPYPYTWSWAVERAQQKRKRRRELLSLVAELSAVALLIGAVVALVWRIGR